MTTARKLTPGERFRVNLRWIWHAQIGWNYERMQGLGYLATMVPVIEKLYGDRPELKKKALKAHSAFFNTTPAMGNIIVGMNVAIEEEMADTGAGIDIASTLKTGLMGPFAGVGDTIFSMIPGAVLGSIAATMAREGSLVGILLWEVWMVAVLAIRIQLFDIGYRQGSKFVSSLSGMKEKITESASVLGLTVVGGMVATMVQFPLRTVSVTVAMDPVTGEALVQQFPLQQYADSIMPKLMPALFAILCYWLLGKKWMNSNRLILAAIVIATVLAALGVVEV